MCDMPHLDLELCAAVVAQSGLATAATTVVGTIAVAFAALTVLGFGLLARRNRTVRKTTAHVELGVRADQLLVRLDDAIADSVEELGFAEAQFGSERGAALEAAIASARALLTSAFSAKQRLDSRVVFPVMKRARPPGCVVDNSIRVRGASTKCSRGEAPPSRANSSRHSAQTGSATFASR